MRRTESESDLNNSRSSERPQIDRIETRDMPLPADAPRTVLYAPTWHGGKPTTNYSSLPLGPRIVDALLARGVTVIFRPHPHTYSDPQQTGIAQDIQRRLSADRKASGRNTSSAVLPRSTGIFPPASTIAMR